MAQVVTSLATTEDGILRDLEEEVAALPSCPNVPEGVPSTTLLVCPHVSSWQVRSLFEQLMNCLLKVVAANCWEPLHAFHFFPLRILILSTSSMEMLFGMVSFLRRISK